MIFKVLWFISFMLLIQYVSKTQSNAHELEQVMVKSARASKVGKLGRPKCSCANLDCSCCFQSILSKSPQKPVCVRASYKVHELRMALDIEVDGKRVGGRSIGPDAVPFCIPAAPLYVCLSANKVFFSSNITMVCITYNIKFVIGTELYKGTFPCFHREDGKFSLSSNRL